MPLYRRRHLLLAMAALHDQQRPDRDIRLRVVYALAACSHGRQHTTAEPDL